MGLTVLLIIGFKTLVVVKGCVVVEVLIAFKVVTPPQSGFVKYVTSMALSLASWVTPIIDPERYSPEPEEEAVPKYYPF